MKVSCSDGGALGCGRRLPPGSGRFGGAGPAPCAFGFADRQEMPDHALTGASGPTAGFAVRVRFSCGDAVTVSFIAGAPWATTDFSFRVRFAVATPLVARRFDCPDAVSGA